MRILISNDDGYLAPGLAALVQAVQGLGQIEVIAPEQNASGTSNALTLNRPLQVFSAGAGLPGVRFINGTPSDCVHVALTGLLGYRPDLVLSGINQGANMGDDTLYSGTVAAAMEGYLFGVPAIAFSQTEKGWALTDAGWMAMSRDRGTQAQALDYGYGAVCDISGAPIDGFITSSAYSPALGHPVAMAMLKRGHQRLGERITLYHMAQVIEAEVVQLPFFDPHGERLHGQS